MGAAIRSYDGPRASPDDCFNQHLSEAGLQPSGGHSTPSVPEAQGTEPFYGSAGGKAPDEGACQASLRLRCRIVKASVEHILSSIQMRDIAVQLASESKMKPRSILQRDRYLLCTTVAVAFGAAVSPGVSESDLWSLPVMSSLPVILHAVRCNLLLRPPAGTACRFSTSDDQLAFDPSACSQVLWEAVEELAVEARPPFAARFSDGALAFFNRWSLGQASLMQHIRDIGSTTVGPSLFGGDVADADLSVAVSREVGQALPARIASERVERNTGLQSGQLNVHVRSWRTPIVDVQPSWCLSATWLILYDGASLVSPSSAPFKTSWTARPRSVVLSYADLAKRLYATRGDQEPGRPAAVGRLTAALSRAARPLQQQGCTHHSEHDQDSCILFLEQAAVFVDNLMSHSSLSMGTAKLDAYAEAALLSGDEEARALLLGRARSIAKTGAVHILRAALLAGLLPCSK